jgi:uncharacterized Rossmann fold enzyme
MIYNEWKETYKKIIQDLGIKTEEDYKASTILDNIIDKRNQKSNIKKIEDLIKNQDVIVFGAGPSLENSIKKNLSFIKNKLKISADGATTALIEKNIIPDIIITDLDGRISDQIYANSKGAIIIIHSHGDNISKLNDYVEEFEGDIIGTTQINPNNFKHLYNFGGFTDGDRAVLLASHFKANNIYLIGFDFNKKIGEYSFLKNKDIKQKIRKLNWCKYILDKENKNNMLKYIR